MIDTVLEIAPFTVRVGSPLREVARHVRHFYGGRGRPGGETFVDFDIQILPARGLRRWLQPQVRFLLDGHAPFHPLPVAQAAPMLEWGLNWAIAQRPLGWLVMHAALLERGGNALMLPGVPGAGKSTLSAALAWLAGWRLMSDELTLLDPADGLVHAHPRPISLKGESIEVVRAFPGARLGPVYPDTRKGLLGHADCPAPALDRAAQPARVRWVVFPRFDAGAPAHARRLFRVEAFTLLAEQSFNRERMGEAGFAALCAMLDGAACWEIEYGSTADALALVARLCTA